MLLRESPTSVSRQFIVSSEGHATHFRELFVKRSTSLERTPVNDYFLRSAAAQHCLTSAFHEHRLTVIGNSGLSGLSVWCDDLASERASI